MRFKMSRFVTSERLNTNKGAVENTVHVLNTGCSTTRIDIYDKNDKNHMGGQEGTGRKICQ
jgi:hypothetical protein